MNETVMSNLKQFYYSLQFKRLLKIITLALFEYLFYSFIIWRDGRKFTYLSVILIIYHALVGYIICIKV